MADTESDEVSPKYWLCCGNMNQKHDINLCHVWLCGDKRRHKYGTAQEHSARSKEFEVSASAPTSSNTINICISLKRF